MHAIETSGTINENGQMVLNKPIALIHRPVKVIGLFEDEDFISDSSCINAIANNPAFSFLNDPA